MSNADPQTPAADPAEDTPLVKELREQLAARPSAEEYRKLAFTAAGVDLESKAGQYLLKGYEGDLSVEAIRAEAEQANALKAVEPAAPGPPTQEPGTTTAPEDRGQASERSALATAATQPGAIEQRDPRTVGLEEFQKELANGAQRDDAAAQFVDRVIDAAAKGDKRVIHDQNAWNQRAAAQESVSS